MILTPVPRHRLPALLAAFARGLNGAPAADAAFQRIADSLTLVAGDDLSLATDAGYHAAAVALARSFGMAILDEDPAVGFSWDGRAVRIVTEPSVLIHEVAHFQLAAPDRRRLADFGLGPGPETGWRQQAEQVRRLTGDACEREEARASLLGVLWEAELGQPAILAFLEQNWLEGGDSPGNRRHFLKVFGELTAAGLLDRAGRPTRLLVG